MKRNYSWTDTGRTKTVAQGHIGASEANAVNSDYGYTGYASAISAISGVMSDQMQTNAFKAQLEAETQAAIRNVGNAMTSFEQQQFKNKETIRDINQVLGDKLSERGLNAIKQASLLRAAAAETGTSGGTTDVAIREAFVNENMDKANIISASRQQTKGILSAMGLAEIGIKNQIDSILLGGSVQVTTNSALKGLQSGLSATNTIFGMIPKSEQASILGIKPTT